MRSLHWRRVSSKGWRFGDLTLLQFSPQAEEMERFAAEVIARTGFRAAPIHGGAQVAIT
jgi:hypothetical protein